jgi:hypothetical protein
VLVSSTNAQHACKRSAELAGHFLHLVVVIPLAGDV